MLSTLKQTYQGKAVQLARGDSLEEQRRQIFADYVERMLQRRGNLLLHYSSEQTKYWLIWLAKQMRQLSQTVFYLENLQINWLEKSRPVEISTSLVFAGLTFPVAFIVLGLEYTVNGLGFALVNGITLLLAHILGDTFSPTLVGVLAHLFDPTGGAHFAHNLAGRDLALALLVTCTPALTMAGLVGVIGARWMKGDLAAAAEADRLQTAVVPARLPTRLAEKRGSWQ